MNDNVALTPAKIYVAPTEERFQDSYRRWQGIPSIEVSPKGRIFVNFYTGQDAEVGGNIGDKAKMTANSLLPSIGKQVDVRDYTNKVYQLMEIDPEQHVPPLLRLSWGSLNFTGHLVKCQQTFTLFSETGTPLRAWVECTFRQFTSNIGTKDLHSPDVTKQRTIHEGDSLWAMSAAEYSAADQWREIARANRISNPRQLRSGDTVVLPALKK